MRALLTSIVALILSVVVFTIIFAPSTAARLALAVDGLVLATSALVGAYRMQATDRTR